MTKSLKTGLDKMAQELLDDVQSRDTEGKPRPFHEKLDAFKAVSAFYIATAKVQKGQPQPDDTGTTFGAIRNRVTNGAHA